MTGPSDTQYERAKSIFLDACELEGGERDRFLREACGDDPPVREAVERLFALDSEHDHDNDDAPALIETGALGELLQAAGADLVNEHGPRVPERLGRYQIEGVLGEGGMGVVYRARQDEPDRDVALKVIRSSIPSHRLIRRFRHEAAVLGRLRHPGIAQVYEAGTAETPYGAQPYFAMELVEGVPLVEYADGLDLNRLERIRLFIEVCEAVQHAHQRGVIHRDLKPGNILVDEHGQPKILDFGVARLVDPDMHTTTMHTEVGQLVGTFQYMSPEQARGNPSDVDTRSDVYALGMILYELLTGRVPYDLSSRSIPEAIRIIEHTSVSLLGTIDRGLRGDLETITNKALAKEKHERYQSAHELAADLQRFLNDEPILAHRPSTWYQVRKFTKRNKVLVTSVSAAFVFLVATLITISVLLYFALNEKDKTERLLQSMLATIDQIDPVNSRGEKATVEQTLDDLLRRVDAELAHQPVVAAQLQHKAGVTFRQLGMYERAHELFEKALKSRRHELGERDQLTMESQYELGHALFRLGRFDQALQALRDAYEFRQSRYGTNDRKTLEAMIDIGAVHLGKEEFSEAQEWLERALAECRNTLGEDDRLTLTAANNLGHLWHRQGDLQEADRILRNTLERRLRLLGPEHLETLESKQSLAWNCRELGEFQEAERLLRETLLVRRRLEGTEHENTLTAMAMLWTCITLQNKENDEEAQLRRELEERHAQVISRAPRIGIDVIIAVARAFVGDGETERGLQLLRDAFDTARNAFDETHNITLKAQINLAVALVQFDHDDEAERVLRDGLRANTRTDRDGQYYTAMFNLYLGRVLLDRKNYSGAEPHLIAGYRGMVEWENERHPEALKARIWLVQLLDQVGRADELDDLLSDN